jgi:hypothetical protein
MTYGGSTMVINPWYAMLMTGIVIKGKFPQTISEVLQTFLCTVVWKKVRR